MDRMKQPDYKRSMINEPGDRRFLIGERIAALSLIVWRLVAAPPAAYWKDWMILVAVYWLYTTFVPRSNAWTTVTTTLTAWLLGIYVYGQLPHALAVLGIGV